MEALSEDYDIVPIDRPDPTAYLYEEEEDEERGAGEALE